MDVASKDTSAAAGAAEAKKKEFETMKSNYVEKLKLQMEQAETQRRNIRKPTFKWKMIYVNQLKSPNTSMPVYNR